LPIALFAAIYLSEIAKKRTRNLLKPLIELLAGIPSVVYGSLDGNYCAFDSGCFNLPVGETAWPEVLFSHHGIVTIIHF
jgi:phosphate transport system permease protein